MKLSTRSRYGFRAMVELAIEYNKAPTQIKVIAKKQDISSKYLEHLMSTLKTAGLVRSIRGPKGGYMLSRSPSEIKASDVFVALEGPAVTVECLDHPKYCSRCTDCATRQVWLRVQNAIFGVLESITLKDLADNALSGENIGNYQI